jgi:soluble lytic murein transglycosylase
VREYPLSFYALEALWRLREADPKRAQTLVDELAAEKRAAPWKFAPRPLFATGAFKRGLELARLGLGAEAKRELTSVGLHPVIKKGAPPPDDEELMWLAAVLYDRAGEYALSHAIPRYIMTDWSRYWPTGEKLLQWQLAYPRGYADLVVKNATVNGQPPALQFAIIREESAFDPLMESFANAIGLTQLTAAPAARFAKGLAHDRAALRDPAINVIIGARELGHCLAAEKHAALAIAAYNAGEGAVNKWRKDPDRSAMSADEFIEAIPYDETRGYTKRVLGTYFTYLWLDRAIASPAARVPRLKFSLPSATRPPAAKGRR